MNMQEIIIELRKRAEELEEQGDTGRAEAFLYVADVIEQDLEVEA